MADDSERDKVRPEDVADYLLGDPEAQARVEALRERLRAGELAKADEQLVDQVIQHLTEKWGDERPCPYCGSTQWAVGKRIVGPSLLRGLAVVPLVQVSCENCGNTVFIHLEAIGLWPPERGEGGESE
jgi:hypothetical protein